MIEIYQDMIRLSPIVFVYIFYAKEEIYIKMYAITNSLDNVTNSMMDYLGS